MKAFQKLLVACCVVSIATDCLAEDNSRKNLERITVTGGVDTVEEVPGSAHFLNEEKLEEALGAVDDIHEALKSVPGVNVTDEEGFGLRPNIGFRGTTTERSSAITLMEDGVLIAPAPYAAPSAYYFPSVGRMEGLEILKGAGQIKYGPRTTGGSLNLLSTSIPSDTTLKVNLKGGSFDTLLGHAVLGDSGKNFGYLLESYQGRSSGFKNLPDGSDTGFKLEDYVAKFRVNTDPTDELYQELELKLQRSNQVANETYLGITREDFDSDPFQRYAASANDRLDVEHDQVQVQHYLDAGTFDFTTTAYVNETQRNWYKIQSVGGASLSSVLDSPREFSRELGWLKGQSSADDAIVLRANNREYQSTGIQSVAGVNFDIADTFHDLEIGARFHHDYEDRFQQEDSYRMDNGSLVLTSAGAPGSNANRRGTARTAAFFVQDKVRIANVTLTPGLRYENIRLTREDWGKEDPTRSGADLKRFDNEINVLIPGLGARYTFDDSLAIFAGVHKGFAPPGPASNSDVTEEESVNYELGIDVVEKDYGSKIVLFLSDYENLLGADTASAGGEGTGDLFNGGAASARGVEFEAHYDIASFWDADYALNILGNYTYTNADFDSSFDSDLFGLVESGDAIPYIPESQGNLGLEFVRGKVRTNFGARYIDSMPTLAGAAGISDAPRTDSAVIFDLGASYKLNEKVQLFGDIENLFDEEYIVAQRPAGARPGRPLTGLVGVEFKL